MYRSNTWTTRGREMNAAMVSRGGLARIGRRAPAPSKPALAMLYLQINSYAGRFPERRARSAYGRCVSPPPSWLAKLPMPVLFLKREEDSVFPSPGSGLPPCAAWRAKGRHVSGRRAGATPSIV